MEKSWNFILEVAYEAYNTNEGNLDGVTQMKVTQITETQMRGIKMRES